MRSVLVATLLVFASTNAFALSGTTKSGYVACLTEEWLDDLMSFLVADDKDSVSAYLASNKCIALKAGVKVTIMDAGFTRIQFAFQGVKMWTVTEAIQLER